MLAAAGGSGLALLILYRGLRLSSIGIDDAYIFAVYARHWVEGKGLVYNPGDRPVEGFTSPLWLWMTAALHRLGCPWEIGALGAACLLFIGMLAMLMRGVGGPLWWRSPGALFIGAWSLSTPGFVLWNTLTLMDTILLSFGVTAASLALWSGISEPAAMFLVLFLALARPEGWIWALGWIGLDALRAHLQREPSGLTRRAARLLLVLALSIAALTAWRLSIFGDLLPNTYYAKRIAPWEAFRSGLLYLLSFIATYPMAAVAVAFGQYTLFRRIRDVIRLLRWASPITPSDGWLIRLLLLTAYVHIGLALPLFTGADHFPMARFYQPIWPALGLILIALARFRIQPMLAAWAHAPRIPSLLPRLIAVFLPISASLLQWDRYTALCCSPPALRMRYEFYLANYQRELARTMNRIFGPHPPEVAVVPAGGFRVEYAGRVLDLMGLNDREMARAEPWHPLVYPGHVAFNARVFFQRRPPIVLPYNDTSRAGMAQFINGFDFNNKVLKGLLTSPEFHRLYRLVRIQRGELAIIAFVERTLAEQLAQKEGWKIEPIPWSPASERSL